MICKRCGNSFFQAGNCPYCGAGAVQKKFTQSSMGTVNIKSNLPDVQTALQSLTNALATAKKEGRQIIKIVHGYGSNGIGGAIREEARKMLLRNPYVKEIIYGETEKYGILTKFPILKTDRDYGRNPGVTFVIL